MSSARGGLSPRVRGNQSDPGITNVRNGPIPACAGEPSVSSAAATRPGAYPRVCGGTGVAPGRSGIGWGLSPRVRGNPSGAPRIWGRTGPIPACAGEPYLFFGAPNFPRAYPRVCGGTFVEEPWVSRRLGLSPRVRGNPSAGRESRSHAGPIPACAGEPDTGLTIRWCLRAYPRVCGGTLARSEWMRSRSGLSPRVRGNQIYGALARESNGPIPACAGEPDVNPAALTNRRAYPRVCGGTGGSMTMEAATPGLSPRVRGNHSDGHLHVASSGPIPACAGEPWRRIANSKYRGAYPRVCGGTSDCEVLDFPMNDIKQRADTLSRLSAQADGVRQVGGELKAWRHGRRFPSRAPQVSPDRGHRLLPSRPKS